MEFDAACWAVCDAYCLCSCEYLFSELFVFSGACSAHRSSSFSFLLVLGGGVSQPPARRAPPLSNTTLLFSFFSAFLLCFLFFLFWNGGCRVVRAQLCEHARDTAVALCVWVCLLNGCVCCFCHSTVFVVPTTHCSLLTITMFTIEHNYVTTRVS